MSSTSKIITAQVGAKLVTIEISSPDKQGARKFKADMFGSVGTLRKMHKNYYWLNVEFCEFDERELRKHYHTSGSTIAECTDIFFGELRFHDKFIQAAQIDTAEPPADLFDTEPTLADHDLNNHEHDKANW